MATSTPAKANSPASINPVGPAPATKTACSVILPPSRTRAQPTAASRNGFFDTPRGQDRPDSIPRVPLTPVAEPDQRKHGLSLAMLRDERPGQKFARFNCRSSRDPRSSITALPTAASEWISTPQAVGSLAMSPQWVISIITISIVFAILWWEIKRRRQ